MIYGRILILLVLTGTMLACAGGKRSASPIKSVSATDSPTVKKLYSQYNSWRGVPYRIGGQSKKGIDCSGFVQLTYKQQFNKKLPRTTELQSTIGHSITQKNLRPGDLVFFKTGWTQRHVGIYVGKGEFLHASSSRGVTLSSLKNPYWANAWWMARRP